MKIKAIHQLNSHQKKLKKLVQEYDDIKLAEISTGLELINNIWYSKNAREVSYPVNGNNECFKIEEKSWWFLNRNKILLEVIHKYTNGKNFFDIGGGNGFVTKSLMDSGFNAFLIEPGPNGILNAKNRGVKNLINSSLQDAKFKINSLDNVGLFDIIEHIENDYDFLKGLNRLIKINGMIFITVPAFSFLWSDIDKLSGHYRRFSLNTLSELVTKSGFTIVFRSYFYSFLVPMIFIFRSLPHLLNKNRRLVKSQEKKHIASSVYISKLIDLIIDHELSRIKKEKRIAFGSSCLIVAKRKD
jgi:2-polyprenyl-3-methyl-5-hydroxy-6-metoxy-1,4-benzoquinol methylase